MYEWSNIDWRNRQSKGPEIWVQLQWFLQQRMLTCRVGWNKPWSNGRNMVQHCWECPLRPFDHISNRML